MRRFWPLVSILLLQQVLWWRNLLANHPQWMVTWDCVVGGMGQEILRGFSFSPLDTWDGVLGGMFVGALFGSPLFALFGVTGATVKAAAALWVAMTVCVAAFFGWELGGRRAAWLCALTIALPPPIQFLNGAVLGHWHYTEILFDLLAAACTVRLLWGPRLSEGDGTAARAAPTARLRDLFALGLLFGVALFNCFGSLILHGAFWLLGLAFARTRLGLRGIAVHLAGVLVGVGPMIWKVVAHVPYGASEGHQKPRVPQELLHVGLDVDKLRELLPGGGFAWGLHLVDAFGDPRGTVATMTLTEVAAAAMWLGALLFGWWQRHGLLEVLRALVRRGGAGVDATAPTARPAVVLLWMGLLYAAAYLLSDMNLQRLPWYLSNHRELGHLVLIPWTAFLLLAAALLAADTAAPPTLRGAAALSLGIVLCLDSAALLVMPQAAQAAPDLPFAARGRCSDVFGFYMSPYLGLDARATQEACRNYGPATTAECWRGAAWAIGYHGADPEAERVGDLGAHCATFDDPWRDECFRGLGWALQSAGEGGLLAQGSMSARCEQLPTAADRRACWRGVGFPLGDHLHAQPKRLMRALLDVPAPFRADVAEGAAMPIGRGYDDALFMDHLCRTWSPEFVEPCRRGVATSLKFRTPPRGIASSPWATTRGAAPAAIPPSGAAP